MGGTVTALAINGRGELFAGTDASGVFRSTDNGNTWTQISSGLPTGVTALSLAINKNGDLFAGTNGNGIFRSTDNGNNWTQINSGLTNLTVLALAINGDGDLYAGSYGVFRSTNNGNTWTQTGLTPKWVHSLVINGSGDVFAGAERNPSIADGGVWRSKDNGNNWTQISNNFGALRLGTVYALAINNSGDIFAAAYYISITNPTRTELFRSTNNGDNWTLILNSGLPTTSSERIFSFATSSNGNLFAGTTQGVFRSTNNGTNWTQTGLVNKGVPALTTNSSGNIFAGTQGSGVFRSTDNGGNWSQINNGLTANYISSFAINSSGNIYAGTYNEGVFRSTDSGNNWTQINNGLPFPWVMALALNSSNHIFVGTQGAGVYRSTDNGTVWNQTGLTSGVVNGLAINSGGNIFAGTSGSGVFRSSDNGNNWVTTGLTNRTVNCLAINSGGDIFAGTDNEGVFRSRDNGSNWTRKNSGLPNFINSLAINSNGVIFAATQSSGVFRSTDNGENWTQTSLTNTYVLSLAINSQGVIFAGTLFGGAYRSTNNGDSWTQLNDGLKANYVRSLALNSEGYIFAGTWGSSVFRSVKSTLVAAPASPTLSFPLDGAVDQPIRLTFNWNPVTDAETYRLQVSTSSTFNTTVFDDSTIANATRQVGPLANNALYYWRVRAKNIGGSSAWSNAWSFTTITAAPAAPTLISPANGSANQATTLAFSWNPATGATTYRLQVSTNSAFNTTVFDDSTIANTSRQVGPLANNAVYYWRVRAKNIGGSSAWSNAWSFTTITAAPTAPTLIFPTNGAANQATTLTFSWNAAPGATTYRLQVSTNSAFSTTVFDDSTLTSTSRQIGSLANNTTHYWRVRAKNIGGTSAWSNAWNFTTISAAPTAPTLISPANGAVSQATTLTFSWNPAPGATTYRLQVSTNSAFSTTVFDDSTLTSTSRQIGSLANNTTHYWRVRAKNIGGTSAWSNAWSFTTIIAAPTAPTLISPANGAVNQSTTLTFSWNPAAGATTYRLQVATNPAFTTTFFDDSTNTTTSRQIASLTSSAAHYWRVRAKNVGGSSDWSNIWSFTTGTTSVSERGKATPTDFSLNQNYPNPFNPSTTILYALPKTTFVRLTVFDPLGKEVETLVSTIQAAGEYEIHWNASSLNSGVYLYRLQAGNFVEVKKMILLR